MAQIAPVNKSSAQNNGRSQRQAAASAEPGDREPDRREKPPAKQKKALLTPLEDVGVTYRPDGVSPNPKESLKKNLDVGV